MGQYFKAVILAPTAGKPEIEASFRAGDYNNGAKQKGACDIYHRRRP